MKLNGNLVLNAAGASEVQNFIIERMSGLPSVLTSEKGRIVFNLTDSIYYYNTGTIWQAFATGGNASNIQTEVNNIELSLGDMTTDNGVFVGSTFTTLNSTIWPSSPTSLTNALDILADYMSGKDTLAELDDVLLTDTAGGQYLRYDEGDSVWVNSTLVIADVTDITSSAAELNILDGVTSSTSELNILDGVTATATEINLLDGVAATLTVTELNYVDGVTSGIQSQLDNKQPLDAGLTALSVFDSVGIIVETATNVWAARTTVAPTAGITITNPAGTAGNITFALANDLAAVEGLATLGFAVRVEDGSWVTRNVATASTDRITVTNGSGVDASPTIDLATVNNGGTGTFLKITRDSYGRVSGTTAVVQGDITGLVASVYVDVSGDSMTGNLAFGGTYKVTGLASPLDGQDAANKNYVDGLITGISWKEPVGSVGATNPTTVAIGYRFLNTTDKKIYVATAGWVAGDPEADPVLDPVLTVWNAGTSPSDNWAVFDKTTDGAYTYDSSTTAWIQFTGAGQIVDGTGLSKSGNTLNVNLGAGVVALPSDEVGLDLFSDSASALILTVNGTVRSTDTASKLALLLPTGSGLYQDATGLYVPANGITNGMILNETITLDADDIGTTAIALGGTLLIAGTITQGISTAISTGTVTITASDASYSQKGVASFNTLDFTVTAGAVSIASLSNSQLDNSSITVTGTTGSDTVSLGESFSIVGGTAPITTASAANSITINVADAGAAVKGLASFNSSHFSVATGAVSLDATIDDLSNVSSADGAATDSILTKSATDWVPVTRANLLGTESIDALSDVVITTPASGQVLQNNGTNWVNKKVYHVEAMSSSTTWTVTHGIGQKFVIVNVYDSTDNIVIPQSIVATSTTVTTITFNTALAGTVAISGVA